MDSFLNSFSLYLGGLYSRKGVYPGGAFFKNSQAKEGVCSGRGLVTSTNSLSQDYTNLDDQLPHTLRFSQVQTIYFRIRYIHQSRQLIPGLINLVQFLRANARSDACDSVK